MPAETERNIWNVIWNMDMDVGTGQWSLGMRTSDSFGQRRQFASSPRCVVNQIQLTTISTGLLAENRWLGKWGKVKKKSKNETIWYNLDFLVLKFIYNWKKKEKTNTNTNTKTNTKTRTNTKTNTNTNNNNNNT